MIEIIEILFKKNEGVFNNKPIFKFSTDLLPPFRFHNSGNLLMVVLFVLTLHLGPPSTDIVIRLSVSLMGGNVEFHS